LGHALGLGHSADASSVMYATLQTGTARRNLGVADLAIPDTCGGPCGLHVSGWNGHGAGCGCPACQSAAAVATGTAVPAVQFHPLSLAPAGSPGPITVLGNA